MKLDQTHESTPKYFGLPLTGILFIAGLLLIFAGTFLLAFPPELCSINGGPFQTCGGFYQFMNVVVVYPYQNISYFLLLVGLGLIIGTIAWPQSVRDEFEKSPKAP